MREADGPVEGAEEIRAMIRQACPHIEAEIARANAMLGHGWKAPRALDGATTFVSKPEIPERAPLDPA